LLARSVVQGYGGKARFVSENYGDSSLAKKYGVTRYPAIFVDDVLVATPNDFGFYGPGEKEEGGRYAPLKSAKAHERFRADLTKMIDLELAGRKDEARARAVPATTAAIAKLPPLDAADLAGKPVRASDLSGKIVLVEMWATWCPPCRGTLSWLGELKKRYGDRLEIVAVAVESEEPKVRKLTDELGLPLRWVMGSPQLVRSFGDIGAVPTLFLFDRSGRTVDVFYGAPPTLHGAAETKLASLLK
jgi:thiol-disulfide isomerase/thioredoxin